MGSKRLRVDLGRGCSDTDSECRQALESKKRRISPEIRSPIYSFGSNSSPGLDPNRFGSVTKDIENLIARKNALFGISNEKFQKTQSATTNRIDVDNIIYIEDDDETHESVSMAKFASLGKRAPSPVSAIIINLDDDDLPNGDNLCAQLQRDSRKAFDEPLHHGSKLHSTLAEECASSSTTPAIIVLEDENPLNENILSPHLDAGFGDPSEVFVPSAASLAEADLKEEDSVSHQQEVGSRTPADDAPDNVRFGKFVRDEVCIPLAASLADTDLRGKDGMSPRQEVGSITLADASDNVSCGKLAPFEDCVQQPRSPVIPDFNDESYRGDKCFSPEMKDKENANFQLPTTDKLCLADGSINRKTGGLCVGLEAENKLDESNDETDAYGEDATEVLQVNKGIDVYEGLEDDEEKNERAACDDLSNIWSEMAVVMEISKATVLDSVPKVKAAEDIEECDHSFIFKDDIGHVCRVCGLIQREIEKIIEFQYAKSKKSSRTYKHEGSQAREQGKHPSDGVDMPGHLYSVSGISVHPRHQKLMKPHQVEGFKFLLSNLVTDNPGGCIMAHAPGSGKTFMIISFIQSFMAKYPAARPLIVLPRGILSTWRNEFQRWQVENVPLYDFYTSKADNRAQQLEVLNQWATERSILLLGYKQFSSIVCDVDTSKTAYSCQKILLTCPSILILDEGHTPRNQGTDILQSLEKVQTPRKVVLSGTLYQNHVNEVFNVLNLVRPRFMKLDTSKAIYRRILSKVKIQGGRNYKKTFSNDDFFNIVEANLLDNEAFDMKVSVIQDLREMTSKVLHYYKGDSLDELPGLVDFTVYLGLSSKQKEEVEGLKRLKNRFQRNSEGSNIYVHPHLRTISINSGVKEKVDERKIDLILENLELKDGVKAKFYLNLLRLCESSGEKLLVFSQYLLPLKFLERLTMKTKGYSLGKEIFVITGDSDSDIRDSYMEQFNTSPYARVFFGSIKACGEGISLVGASRVIILDVHLNPSVTRQAIGRAFRPGQVRKVYIYRLIASDSPEEEDHLTCFKKESISRMWFEWNGSMGEHHFDMEIVNPTECGDFFLETSLLNDDVTSLCKR